jgi:hypothetical protein
MKREKLPESHVDSSLRSALGAVADAEAWEKMARNYPHNASMYLHDAKQARRRADDLLGLYNQVDAYGTTRERVIDAVVRREVARMVAHAETVTELCKYIHEVLDEDPEDLW